MTVRDLLVELQGSPLDYEVVVSDSPTSAYRLLGVFDKEGRVYLDPSKDEKDRVEGFLSE